MPYVQRDAGGKVTGVFRQRQEGYAEELLPDDHPEVLAHERGEPKPAASPQRERDRAIEELESAIAEGDQNKINNAVLKVLKGTAP